MEEKGEKEMTAHAPSCSGPGFTMAEEGGERTTRRKDHGGGGHKGSGAPPPGCERAIQQGLLCVVGKPSQADSVMRGHMDKLKSGSFV